MTPALVILCAAPDIETARRLAGLLLDAQAAACVTILPGAESHYVWQGKREAAAEHLLLIKAVPEKYDAVEALILKNHPYDCPEIIALPAEKISPAYLAWLRGA